MQNPPSSELRSRLRRIRRLLIAVIGSTVLALGVVMIVLPGPSILVIPLGLAILATEFVWARVLLKRLAALISSRKKNSRTDR